MVYNGKLVFAESESSLNLYVRKTRSGTRLLDGKHFIDFSKSMSSKSNIYAYLDFKLSKPVFNNSLNKKNLKIYNDNTDKFSKIQAIAVQYGVSGDMVFTNFYTNLNVGIGVYRKEPKSDQKIDSIPCFSINFPISSPDGGSR